MKRPGPVLGPEASPLRPILVVLLIALIPAPALAQGCVPTSASPEFTLGACAVRDAPCFYIDNDPCGGHVGPLVSPAGECVFSIWVYQESNGIAGLQRRDEVRDDTCGGEIAGDTIVL